MYRMTVIDVSPKFEYRLAITQTVHAAHRKMERVSKWWLPKMKPKEEK